MTPNQYTFRYRVRNWSDYNRALIARGRLTFWFDEDAVAAWRNADPPKGPGAPKVYSDTAIQCALILKSVFQLSLRSTQGFVSSLLELLRLGCFIRELLLTFSLSSTTCDSAWVSRGFSVIKHV